MEISLANRARDCSWDRERILTSRRFKYAKRLCIVCSVSCLVACCMIESDKHIDHIELSSHMRGGIGHHHEHLSVGDIHTTASRHASNPLVITPDIAKALDHADSVIKSTQRLLVNQHEPIDDDDDDAENAERKHETIAHEASAVKMKIAPKSNRPIHEEPKSAAHGPTVPTSRETPKELAKEKAESELWKTEQAMKKELDAQTAHKSGKLWQHTVSIVHRTDPNAKLISKLNAPDASSDIKKAVSLKRVESKPDTIKSRLKAELDAKTKNDMGRMEDKTMALQKQGLDRDAHESKVAETAAAHKTMPLSDMKKMLTSQLDASLKHKAKHGNTIKASALETRLKAELDAKTEEQEKKLLQSQNDRRSLVLARKNLHGRVVRAAKVRHQLSKEMAEEDAIRKQLDLRAEKAGKRMLQSEMSGNKAGSKSRSRGASREALEAELRKRLETRTQQILKSRRRRAPRAHQSTTEKMEKELQAHLASKDKDEHVFHLQDYLRKQLDASDATTQKQLYRKTVQAGLVKGMHARGSAQAASRARALHAAAMRLFKASMRRSERKDTGSRAPRDIAQERRALAATLKSGATHGRPADAATAELMKETLQRAGNHEPFAGLHREEAEQRQQAASAPPPPSVHTATVALMKEALQRSGGRKPFAGLHRREALESRAVAAQRSRAVNVHTALERVMESSLRRAKGVRPFADLHGSASTPGVVHDMAAANRESTLRAGGLETAGKLDPLVLGHYAELQDADATAAAIRRARTRTVHEAEQEEQQAVE